MEFEIEEGYTCEKCGETFDSEISYYMHMADHDTVTEIEKLSAKDQEILVTGLQMIVYTEELRLKKDYGYKIPQCSEELAKEDLDNREKEFQIREAMSRYLKIGVGEIKWDGKSWIVPPVDRFNLKDYTPGFNIFEIKHYTRQHAQETERKLGNKPPTPEIAEKVIRGEYDESVPKIKTKEELAKDAYEDLTERLFKLFEPLWSRKGKVKYDNLDVALQEAVLLNMGKEIFRYMRCPVEDCTFKVPRKLSRKAKYVSLVRHYLEAHISQLKGTTELSVMKRYLKNPAEDAMAKARKEFTHPREEGDDESVPGKLMPHQTGAPNPEQCNASFEQLTKDKLPKDDSLPSVSKRRGMFDDLRKKKDTSKDLARIYGDIVPDPEELEELKEQYKPYYYEDKKSIRCKVCKAKLDSFRRFLIHMRTEHRKQYSRPSKYKDYYEFK